MGFYFDKERGKWVGEVIIGKKTNGKYDRKKQTFFKLKKQSEEAYIKWKMELRSGDYIEPSHMIFSAFVGIWRDKHAERNLAIKTLRNYNCLIEKHILPTLGPIRMDKIKPIHIVDLFDELTKKELSTGTIGTIFTLLKGLFIQAEKWELIKKSPMANLEKRNMVKKKKAKGTNKEISPFNVEETRAILSALNTIHDDFAHWRTLVQLAFETGMRRGELLALEWKYIDLEKGVIDVQQTYNLLVDGVPLIKEPKTEKSKRLVTISKTMVEELKKYRLIRKKERLLLGGAWQGGEYDFVFSHPHGKAFSPEALGIWFTKFLKANGFRPARFHDIRHTHATYLISKGVDIKTVSARLGHSSVSITLDIYAHFLRSADQAAANLVNDLYTIQG